jgi:hypothetical protein
MRRRQQQFFGYLSQGVDLRLQCCVMPFRGRGGWREHPVQFGRVDLPVAGIGTAGFLEYSFS